MRPVLSHSLIVLLGATLLCAFPRAQSQEHNQRLVLKDGSYQSVVKYEVQGDRVHYLSAERYEWEDIPSDLINWGATDKYNQALTSGKMRVRIEDTPEEKEEREKEEANSPEIAPGLRLPGTGGVFLADQFHGHPELAEIVQNGSDVEKASRKKSVLRSAVNPLAGSKQAFEIKGAHAQVQSHIPRPTIYVEIDEQAIAAADSNQRFRIVQAAVRGDKREIGDIKVSVTGKVAQETRMVPAKVERLGTGAWLKITPAEDLAPGEYALVEMLSPNEMNLYVWDFGVNANAPANASAAASGQ
jgi:hypothetical protein